MHVISSSDKGAFTCCPSGEPGSNGSLEGIDASQTLDFLQKAIVQSYELCPSYVIPNRIAKLPERIEICTFCRLHDTFTLATLAMQGAEPKSQEMDVTVAAAANMLFWTPEARSGH